MASTVIRAARVVASARVRDGIRPTQPEDAADVDPRDPPPVTPEGGEADLAGSPQLPHGGATGRSPDEGAGRERSDA